MGTTCHTNGGQVCDDSGDCVVCLNNTMCSAATPVCNPFTNQCAAVGCNDGVKDGSETGIDCGGGTCPACGSGMGCASNSDCMDNNCVPALHKCYPPTCFDNMKDGTETDLDCGGQCPKCPSGKMCNGDSDCLSDTCLSNKTCQ
jgi:hypothetical protein